MVYSGLFSHANYPKATDLWVYERVELGDVIPLFDLEALYIADRTLKSGKRFEPTVTNVKYLSKADYTTDESLKWARFSGKWGVPDVATADRSFTCLDGG